MSDEQPTPSDFLDAAQLRPTGDMDADDFRRHGRAVVDWIADYLEGIGDLPVLGAVTPGDVRRQLPDRPPDGPESMAEVMADLDRIIVPGLNHWNHPAFHAYFGITASGPGILGEALAAAFNVNAMLWKSAPAATELEQVVTDWLRQLLGLSSAFHGTLMDGASAASLVALAAARERIDMDIRQRGLAGRFDVPLLRVYVTDQTHSSVEKGAITLGLGRDGVRVVATDAQRRMDPVMLEEAIREDLRLGIQPMAVVATVGTTATTSVDPVAAIADVCDLFRDEVPGGLWLHVDGAYGGIAGITERARWVLDGVDRADSFVTNPHKWLFTPIDCTAFYVKDVHTLTHAFSVVPEYLHTAERDDVVDYMDWGVQLGRRFRALKLWMVMRYFGADGLRSRVEHALDQAQRVAAWVDDQSELERVAEVPLSTVCFRVVGDAPPEELDATTAAVADHLNRSGVAFVMTTVLDDRTVIRFPIGNLKTTDERLEGTLNALNTAITQATWG